MELGRRVSFPRGFRGSRASRTTLRMGWSWGYVATVDRGGRTPFVADAHHTERLKDEIKAKLALAGGG
jgi:hypothetical protein